MPAQRARVDSAMVKVLAHAHRWRRVLESGEYASITKFAAVKNINQYYVCRILRLTLLSRRIVEMILGAQQRSQILISVL